MNEMNVTHSKSPDLLDGNGARWPFVIDWIRFRESLPIGYWPGRIRQVAAFLLSLQSCLSTGGWLESGFGDWSRTCLVAAGWFGRMCGAWYHNRQVQLFTRIIYCRCPLCCWYSVQSTEYIGKNSPKVEKTVKVFDRFSTADLQIGWIQW